MVPEIEGLPEVDTLVPVGLVVLFERLEDAQLDAGSIAVFLHRTDDLDGHLYLAPAVPCLDDLAEGALSEELDDGVLGGSQ